MASSSSSSLWHDLCTPTPLLLTQTQPQSASNGDDDSCNDNDNDTQDSNRTNECNADEYKEKDDTVMTWDSTFQREIFSSSVIGSATLCPHAVGVGTHIYGGLRSLESELPITTSDEVDSTDMSALTQTASEITAETAAGTCWWTWMRSLETRPTHQRLTSSSSSSPSFGSNNNSSISDTNTYSSNKTTNKTKSDRSDSTTGSFIAADLVTCVASNASGTVIAVATDAGVVSLLRVLDGQVLATRHVCTSTPTTGTTTGTGTSHCNTGSTISTSTTPGTIHLSWVSSPRASSYTNTEHDDGDDVLWMELPVVEEDDATTLIVVTNIQGFRLNHSNPTIVAEAARQMQISQPFGLPPPPPPGGNGECGRNLRALTACRHINVSTNSTSNATATTAPPTSSAIRWIACDGNGTSLVVWDYETRQRRVTFVASGLELADDGTECLIDFDVGFVTQTTHQVSFVVCTAVVGPDVRLFWFDPVQLKTCCSFTLPAAVRFDTAAVATTKVMAIESVESHNSDDALAIAVAIKSTQQGSPSICQFLIVQVLVWEDTPSMGLRDAHIMYTIPAPESMLSVAMASLCSSIRISPYSFRCQIWHSAQQPTVRNNSSNCSYIEYRPDHRTSLVIGRIRSLLRRHEFDAADEIVASCGAHALIRDGPAQFYPSEIAFFKLKYLLGRQTPFESSPNDSTEQQSMLHCLQRLACGAVEGGDTGMALFLSVIDLVTQSPSTYTCEQFYAGLQSLAVSIQTVSDRAMSQYTNKLLVKKQAVVGRIASLEFLSLSSSAYPLTTPFTAVHSPERLYQILVCEGKFALAESLYRSNLQSLLTLKDLVLPVLHISSNVHPRDYLALLRDIIIPSLSINHDLFLRLRLWSCQVADSFDDEGIDNMGLDAAILLLTVLDKGARVLQSQIFSSLGTRSPFADFLESRSTSSTPSFKSNSAALGSTASKRKPLVAVSTCHSDKLPSPTILGHGSLKLQAAVQQARSNNFSENLHVSDVDDCLNVKLVAAQCLQQSRNLGLGRSVTLRSFEARGGVKYIAMQLVRHLSALSDTHGARHQRFRTTLFPFCKRFTVCQDQAMLDCVIDKCRGKNVSASSIEECCSIVRCCSSVTMRCQLALAVFRAALLCTSTQGDLAQLSKDSILWASSDSILQSELKEASRILQIDLIVLKYCGSGARELFHVDNPRHATRLLNFVALQVENTTVVSDALSLCDGFHHLCRQYAARKLMENAYLHKDEALYIRIFIELTEQSTMLAEHVLITSICFSEEILCECSNAIRSGCSSKELDTHSQRARLVTSRVASLNRCAIEKGIVLTSRLGSELNYILKDATADVVRDVFVAIERLQRDHSVYVSLSELANTKAIVEKVAQFIEDLAQCFKTSDCESIPKKFAQARRICTLLTVLCKTDAHDIWVAASTRIAKILAGEQDHDVVEKFLFCVGALTTSGQGLSSRAQVSTAVALCSEAMRPSTIAQIGMYKCVEALSLLNDWAARNASGKLLAAIVEFAGHLDVACQVFSRCEETGELVESQRHCLLAGSWNGMPTANANHSASTLQCSTRIPLVNRPVLHQSWYIGDGLLLPPKESLPQCLQFCRGMINMHATSDDGSFKLWTLVSGRGAHSLALRVLCHSTTIRVSIRMLEEDGPLVANLDDAFCGTTRSLVERSLGGTGSGITCSVVDSQLAVGFLLILPVKEAYDAYKSCIPTAVKTHNYRRLFVLSNVGMVAASRDIKNGFSPLLGVGWKRQEKFLEQCQRLSTEAKWWAILRDHNIEFDSQRFQDPKVAPSSGKHGTAMESKYAVTLLPALLEGMSRSFSYTDVARFAVLYAKTFRFPRDLVLSRHAEFLLSMENSDLECDVVFDLNHCETAALTSLHLLQSPFARADVLRKCLVRLDTSATSGQDYERYGLVLNLYYKALSTVQEQQSRSLANVAFEEEFDAICRRRDTLTILSAFFQGDLSSARPKFSAFFLPLPFAINDKQTKTQSCNILGSSENELLFDPLLPLEPILTSACDNSVVTALAPLCVPLGLPQGFIHARSLIARFRRSHLHNGEYPSFENDVTPVLNRIVCHRDRALLVEWCTQQYSSHSVEKLKCLDALLHAAITASTEVEQRRKHFPIDKELEQMEVTALDELKHVGLRKDSLSSVLRVRAVFLPYTVSAIPAVKQLYELMILELDSYSKSHPDLSQECLVDFLFSKGSMIATQAILDTSETFSIRHFRQFCSTVHAACQSIADQHSHINLGNRTWRLAQQWLFYGDDIRSSLHVDDRPAPTPTNGTSVNDSHDEDTLDFVMDLSVIHDVGAKQAIDTAIGALQESKELRNVISTEEASVLRACSMREQSDAASQRAALRIAFVLAFSYPFTHISNDTKSKENSDSARHNIGEKNGLLARIPTKLRGIQTPDQSSELLQIVFAKPGNLPHLMKGMRLFVADSSIEFQRIGTPQTITFAMRHMALQTAAILCPQEALEEVIRKEGYLRTLNIEKPPSLRECAFGVFVAKEVEEMGLPLPHSDLVQLSSMNFLSYSRVLWRHHREDIAIRNSKGRLLRLLLEMSLRHDETDGTFISNLIDEMMRISMPRTLLLSLERIAEYQSRRDILALLSTTLIDKSIGSVVSLFLRESKELLAEPSATNNPVLYSEIASSFDSLFKVSFTLLDSKSANKALREYAERLAALFKATNCPLATNLHRNIAESHERYEKQHHIVKVDAFVKFSGFSSPTAGESSGRCTITPIR